MEFIKKINFIVDHLDRYNDFCKVPNTHKIHEKIILTAKQMLYNNNKVHSFINIHGCLGFVTMILDFPNSTYQCDSYIKNIRDKTLDQNVIKKIGFPLVDSVIQRSLVATGGTVLASKLAINYGLACNTAGGSHHANFEGGAG